MRLRLVTFASVAVLVAACGGGGGGGGSSSGIGFPPATPTPIPTPFANGDAFAYQGVQQTNATFNYPSPSPYPSKNTTVNVSQNITVGSTAYPNGSAPSAGDFHSTESDVAALVTHTYTGDTWIGLSGSNLVEYGSIVKSDSGDTTTTHYPTPYDLDGNLTNTASTIIKEQFADGTATTRTYNSDGSYTETGSLAPAAFNEQITENADGSGSYTSDAFIQGYVSGFTFSKPSGNTITINETFPAPPTPTPAPGGAPPPTPNPSPTPRVISAPSWYTTPVQLYAEHSTVTANSAFPASCNVPSSYGSSGTRVERTVNRTDTILGYTDALDTTSYNNASGLPVCVVLQDTQTNYYDYQDDYQDQNGYHFHFSGTPLSTSTISQTLTLQSGATIHAATRRASSLKVALDLRSVAAAQSAFAARVERQRHEREKGFLRLIKSLSARRAR